jgi:ubiquinone/menaquinone biosynthesis C-methylase UbiE
MAEHDHTSRRLWARTSARLYDPFLALGERRGMRDHRRALLARAEGAVLELGAGTGLNLPHYPAGVELVLTEPEPAMRAVLERRVARSGRPARVLEAPAEALPFADATFDTVVSTMVLCTVHDAVAAIAEARRVLKPAGRLLFVEHVRAPSERLARWQDRLAAPWAAFAQGCRCNLDTEALLERELCLERVDRARWRGMPALVRPLIVGEAQIRPSRAA